MVKNNSKISKNAIKHTIKSLTEIRRKKNEIQDQQEIKDLLKRGAYGTVGSTHQDQPFITPLTYVYIEEDEGRDRLAHGFFPFLTAGVNVPLNAMSELLFEFQFDFEKKDAGWDLGGPIFMLGLRFRSR